MEGGNRNNNHSGMSEDCYARIILLIIGGVVLLAVAAFAMILFCSASSFIWPGIGAAILCPGICYLKQNETDDICTGIFLLACGIAALLLGIFNVTLILEFNLVLGSCFGIPFILSGLFCVSDYVFKRKECKDNEIFYHRYMYISGFITAITCAFLVAFGVVPFATVASLAGPFVCFSLCFFFHRLGCCIQNHVKKNKSDIVIESTDLNEEDEHGRNKNKNKIKPAFTDKTAVENRNEICTKQK